jgi:poly(3-hydroxybutyrate) depolymerase
VVVVIADAHRDFTENLQRFVEARAAMPFLLVAPEVLTCGGTRDQTSPPYSYTVEEWRAARAIRDHDFDDAGLAAVLAEVHAKWGGEARAYLTGWEAGGHTVWAQALRRPERWLAVASVTTNYQRRGLTPETFSHAPEREALPIQVFWCDPPQGEAAAAMQILRQQTEHAIADARAHGFAPAPVRVVAGADHGPLEAAVLAWFDSLAQLRR